MIMENQHEKQGVFFKITFLSSSLLLVGVTAIGALVSEIGAAFPDISIIMIQSLVTIPSIAQMLSILIGGVIAYRLGKKNLLLLGIICFIAGGIGPMFANNYYVILALRLLVGIAVGLLQPLTGSLIADFFSGKERGTMMGLQSTTVGIGGASFNLLIDILLIYGWKSTFIIYPVIGCIVLILSAIFIPSEKNLKNKKEVTSAGPKEKMPGKVYVCCVVMFFFQMTVTSLFISLALSVSENNIGTSADSAFLITILSVGSLITGVLFGVLYNTLKKNLGIISLTVSMISLWILGLTSSLPSYYLGALLSGFGFGSFMPFLITEANERTTVATSAMATGIVFFGNSLGNFAAPYVLGSLAGLIGNNSSSQFVVAAIIQVILCIFVLVYWLRDTKNGTV
jgi:MFS family permease